MILQLQGYNFEIEHVKSGNNISNFISQHPNKQEANQRNKKLIST